MTKFTKSLNMNQKELRSTSVNILPPPRPRCSCSLLFPSRKGGRWKRVTPKALSQPWCHQRDVGPNLFRFQRVDRFVWQCFLTLNLKNTCSEWFQRKCQYHTEWGLWSLRKPLHFSGSTCRECDFRASSTGRGASLICEVILNAGSQMPPIPS